MLNYPDRTEIIIGNPGCGKTTELVRRVAELLEQGIHPTRIAYCSFSVTAIDEAIKRATEKCGLKKEDFPYFRTLHSFAFQMLGLNAQQIMQDYHLKEFGMTMGMNFISSCQNNRKLKISSNDDNKLNIVNIARLYDKPIREYMIENKIDFTDVASVQRLADMYKNYKIMKSVFDYTDMLILAKTAELDIPELDYLFIDEAQDLSTLQWCLVERLAEKSQHIIIAGDDKQSINTFAGADVDYFLKIPGKVTVLEQSYRVPKRVFSLANRIVKHMDKYREEGSQWKPREEEGTVNYVNYMPFYQMGSGEWLVLARTNSQLDSLKRMMIDNCDKLTTLFTVNGEPPVDMEVFRAIELFEMADTPTGLTKMDLITFKEDDTDEQRKQKVGYVQLFKKFIGDASTERERSAQPWELTETFLRNYQKASWTQAFTKLTLSERRYIGFLRPHYAKLGENLFDKVPVRLMTIHTAKGTEADNVVVFMKVPRIVAQTMDKYEEDTEVKVFYVAATRAKKKLYLLTLPIGGPKSYKCYTE